MDPQQPDDLPTITLNIDEEQSRRTPDGDIIPITEETPLTRREARFVEEYLFDLNGRQAAIRAGFSHTSATVTASRLHARANVAAAIERLKAERAARIEVKQDQVLHEMSLLANSSLEHYIITYDGQVRPAPGAPEGAMRAIQSIKKKTRVDKEGNVTYDVEVKLWDKPSPLKLMGRHVGLFPDRVEVTGKNGSPLEMVTRIERVIVDPAGGKP